MVLAQMLPPLPGAVPRAPTPPAAVALTAAGRTVLPLRLARAPRARALFERLDAAAGASPAGIAFAALTARERGLVRAWLAHGWVDAAPQSAPSPPASEVPLNPDQQAAAGAVVAALSTFAPFLLQGVTGSGKTNVYLAVAAAAIAAGGQALLLVPEINLTPQLAQRIAAALPGRRLVLLHSRLAGGERARAWAAAAAGEADLVLGTRLAVFAPLPRLALIVVDEEQDASFKQQDGVRYHGRDVALWRARQRGVPIVLGSATPSLEALHRAQRGRCAWLKLPQRAVEPARLPALRFEPCRAAGAVEGLGLPLLAAIEARLARGRAIADLHQPPRLFPVAAVRGLRLAGGLSALQRAAGRAPRRRRAALPPLRPRRAPAARLSRVRQRRPHAAGPRHAAAGGGARRALSGRAHRCASTATARSARAPSRRCARASTRGRSTSSSARRCSPRATIFRD